ncbi:MAG TPA: hypothetical protein VMW17_11535 [Candidatus Binatia bacterium]|nr:hypothetical protein [Candidatus Binatia bacterium]
MAEALPGFNQTRLLTLMHAAVKRCDLDLSDAVVFTEAATGAYVVTPVLAALAGANVTAIARPTRHGTVEQVADTTNSLARAAGVSERIRITTERTQTDIGQADIVTNSGHVRPVDAEMVGWMKPSAVIPLMYEAWEFRDGDVDLEACKRRGIRVAGTNERHPSVDVFSYLGIMAVKLLLDAGIAVYGCKILVCCDNPFEPYLRRGLRQAGAEVECVGALVAASLSDEFDALLVALRPQAHVVIGPTEAALIRERSPGAVVAQYWGDIDRSALDTAGVRYWPPAAPALGHMAILPAAVGPEPTVRLQAGGLKVAEILWRSRNPRARVDRSYLTELGVSDEV